MLIYLGLSIVAVFALTLTLHAIGAERLALTHLLLTGGIAPLILAATAHFMPVLTRGRGAPAGIFWAPLVMQCTGAAVFLAFGLNGDGMPLILLLAAVVALLVTLIFMFWLMARAVNTLGQPHPCWRWYLAAFGCLALALALVPAMIVWPELRREFRLVHLHLNTLGFIGLAALGTLQVLLPTALGAPDPGAAARLRRQLPVASIAVLAIAIGAAAESSLALAGTLMLAVLAASIGRAWIKNYGRPVLIRNSPALSLCAALAGFLALLVTGAAHGLGLLDGKGAIQAFATGFLMPLVTGALSELLPVWRHPGRRTDARERMRVALAPGVGTRSLLFLSASVSFVLGLEPIGLILATAGLLRFVPGLMRSFLEIKIRL